MKAGRGIYDCGDISVTTTRSARSKNRYKKAKWDRVNYGGKFSSQLFLFAREFDGFHSLSLSVESKFDRREYFFRDESLADLQESNILNKNINHLTTLRNWLKPVLQSIKSRWRRCWLASVDGWKAETFHLYCDNKGPTVTIIRVGQCIFGGYTSASWVSSTCGYRSSSTAFLFSLVNKESWAPLTFRPPGPVYSYEYATYSCSSHGPTFGRQYDIYISTEASSNTNSHSNLGYTYKLPSGYSYGSAFAQSFMASSANFRPDEVEVFYETGYK